MKPDSIIKKFSSLNVLWLAFCVLFSLDGVGQVTSSIDSTTIKIGEELRYRIQVDADTTSLVVFSEEQTFQPLEMINSYPIDSATKGNSYKLTKTYGLTQFDSGVYTIPKQKIIIGKKAFYTDSLKVWVNPVIVDTTKQKLFPIKAIQSEPLVYDDFKPYIIWGILILILIAVFVYYFVYRKKPIADQEEPIVQIPPYDEAIEKLQKLDSKLLWQNNQIKKYYSELTEIIRDFIEKELKIPALEITTQELIEALSNLDKSETLQIDKETTRKLNSLLSEADLVKFAKSTPLSHEIEDDRKDAENILNDLKPSIIEEAENDELE